MKVHLLLSFTHLHVASKLPVDRLKRIRLRSRKLGLIKVLPHLAKDLEELAIIVNNMSAQTQHIDPTTMIPSDKSLRNSVVSYQIEHTSEIGLLYFVNSVKSLRNVMEILCSRSLSCNSLFYEIIA